MMIISCQQRVAKTQTCPPPPPPPPPPQLFDAASFQN